MKHQQLSFRFHNRLYEDLKYMSLAPLALPSSEIWYKEKNSPQFWS